jgi:hypothetical protein
MNISVKDTTVVFSGSGAHELIARIVRVAEVELDLLLQSLSLFFGQCSSHYIDYMCTCIAEEKKDKKKMARQPKMNVARNLSDRIFCF